MGIINVTPDSFSDGNRYNTTEKALARAHQLIDEGADILDIGAESTRPGHQEVSAEEEWGRLLPVLRALCGKVSARISVDTMKAEVAERAAELGVDIINDVWGGLYGERMLSVVANAGCEYIWMHNRNTPVQGQGWEVLIEETKQGIERCLQAGISPHCLWIDPGIGFGKTHAQNLEVLARLEEYTSLGQPVLLGVSRKSVIGRTLELPVEERLEGSLAIASLGVWARVSCIRVHDVQATVRTCRMVEAIQSARP